MGGVLGEAARLRHVRLREHGRNVLVELVDGNGRVRAEDAAVPSEPAPEPREPAEEPAAAQPGEPRAADGIREVRRIFQSAPNPPRFPMYVRQAKQFMRSVDPTFDERKFGFGSLQDLLRACLELSGGATAGIVAIAESAGRPSSTASSRSGPSATATWSAPRSSATRASSSWRRSSSHRTPPWPRSSRSSRC